MSTMKAARIFGPHDLRLVDVPIPRVGDQDVLCKVVRAGMCGTDYAIYTGEFSFVKSGQVPFPMTPGHEWSGIVEKIGPAVHNVKVGDRVVGDTGVSCGQCYDCLVGQYYHCKQSRAVGTIKAWDGAYAEYILMPARHIIPLPDRVSFDNGAMVEPAATALGAVTQAQVGPGDSVLVLGSGPIGIAAAVLAKICGAAKVVIAARKDFKLQAALDLGVDAAINTTRTALEDAVKREFADWGVEKIVEAAGSTDLFKRALDLINPDGILSVVAFYERKVDGFDIDCMVFGNVKIKASSGSLGMYRPILRLMAAGRLDLTSLITDRYVLDQVPQAMRDMQKKNERRIKMMIG